MDGSAFQPWIFDVAQEEIDGFRDGGARGSTDTAIEAGQRFGPDAPGEPRVDGT
jgi:hypothetical protein